VWTTLIVETFIMRFDNLIHVLISNSSYELMYLIYIFKNED